VVHCFARRWNQKKERKQCSHIAMVAGDRKNAEKRGTERGEKKGEIVGVLGSVLLDQSDEKRREPEEKGRGNTPRRAY